MACSDVERATLGLGRRGGRGAWGGGGVGDTLTPRRMENTHTHTIKPLDGSRNSRPFRNSLRHVCENETPRPEDRNLQRKVPERSQKVH